MCWWSGRCAGPASCRRRMVTPDGGAIVHPADRGRCRRRDAGPAGAEEVRSWFKARLGPHAGFDDRADRRVLGAVLGAITTSSPEPPTEAPTTGGRPARLRARPELHLGAADATCGGRRSPSTARRRPRRPRPETTTPSATTTSPTSETTARRRRRRWSIPTARAAAGAADHHADADPHAHDAVAARAGTGADHAGCAEIALSGLCRVPPLHWRAVMITLDHVSQAVQVVGPAGAGQHLGQDRQG